jgi:hypothetical protein
VSRRMRGNRCRGKRDMHLLVFGKLQEHMLCRRNRNRLEDNIKIVEVSTVFISSTKMYLENWVAKM